MQAPMKQRRPMGQTLPQRPQLLLLPWRLVQVVPQSVEPVGHAQVPIWQAVPHCAND